MDAAQRLIEVRNIFHMNQREFSQRTGIAASLISQMERGLSGVSWKTAHAVEDALGISAGWLMTGEGEIVPDRRADAGSAGRTVPLDRFPAVAEMIRLFAGRMTLPDWEALNGICERVLGKQVPAVNLVRTEKRGA